MPRYSVIIPARNEAGCLGATLEGLQAARRRGCEVLLADGGSVDGTVAAAAHQADQVLECAPGRARQMNRGAARAAGAVLVFLHADTLLPGDFDLALNQRRVGAENWGWFTARLASERPVFRCIETLMNLRSRLTRIATGDQAIFVGRRLFQRLGGYADLPLMEDIELCARLRRLAPPVRMEQPALSSARRWETHGVIRTILLMWKLRCWYALGANPAALARQYD